MKNNYLTSFFIIGFLFSTTTFLAQNKLSDSQYGVEILEYLEDNKDRNSISSNDLQDIYVKRSFDSKKTGTTHVYITQRHQGIEVFNSESSIAIKNGKVFYHTNGFTANLSQKVNATNPLVSAKDAISNAASHFGLNAPVNLNLIGGTNPKDLLFNKGGISQEDIPVKLVYQLIDNQLRLAWNMSIITLDGNHWWSFRVDAISGKVIDTNDWILKCKFGEVNHTKHSISKPIKKVDISLFKTNASIMTDGSQYNVFALPLESPNHGPRQVVSEPANLTASPYGWHDTDGIAGAEYTITRGNNVLAQLDEDGDNGSGYTPDGTGSLDFDFPLDFDQQPIGYRDAAVTNLFYMNNMMHDIWFNYGFDEEAGNFQEKNYTAPPIFLGDDAVNADAQDGSSIDNANFGTPPDGGNPRMQMFLWAPSTGDVLTIKDGALAGTYTGSAASFGELLPIPPLTADLELRVDGLGDDFNDGCEFSLQDLTGKIAVIRRGNCEFGLKVLNAENLGAVAVIVVNNEAGATFNMGPGDDGDTVTIPSIMVNQTDGEALITALDNGDIISATLTRPIYIDGDFDNGVIAHEYGHGISNRLTGGATTSDCLDNQEQMGEGWSDWFGLMVTMKSSDKATDARGIGTFVSEQDIDGPGIRTQPYSTDKVANNFTYADIDSQSVPHGVGSVWATMLWDLTWAYIDKYGFDADLYNGTGGNNKAMELIMKGMMLQACSPGFVDGRNAILAADFDLTGGENQCIIWEVFADRGLGFNADQGSASFVNDQTEDFTVPDEADVIGAGLPTLTNCQALSNANFNEKDYKIYPNPTNGRLVIKTTKSLGDALITISDINGRQILTQKAILLGEVELNINTLQSGIYILNIKGEFINTSEKIIKN